MHKYSIMISNLYSHSDLQMSHYIQAQLSWQTTLSVDGLRLPKAALMHPMNNTHTNRSRRKIRNFKLD